MSNRPATDFAKGRGDPCSHGKWVSHEACPPRRGTKPQSKRERGMDNPVAQPSLCGGIPGEHGQAGGTRYEYDNQGRDNAVISSFENNPITSSNQINPVTA